MSISSIFRRLVSGNPILCRRKFCTIPVLRPSSPCLMLPHSFIGGGRDMVYNFYSPTNDKVMSFNNKGGREETQLMQDDKTKLVGCSHGWLALYNSGNRGVFLLNPVSGRCIDLPPLAGKPFFMEEMPLKLIMSCPPDEEECRAVLILKPKSGQDVFFCSPGRSGRWARLSERHRHDDIVSGFTSNDSHFTYNYYLDFVYSTIRKRFVTLVHSLDTKHSLRVEYWDINDSLSPRMDRVELDLKGIQMPPVESKSTYIVCVESEESDQLFAVSVDKDFDTLSNKFAHLDDNRVGDLEFHYDVCRIKDGGELELCSSLDDLAMFVGINHSIASPSHKHNCIYFADPGWNIKGGQYIEIFDYQKKTRSPLYFPSRHQKTQSTMIWITPTFD